MLLLLAGVSGCEDAIEPATGGIFVTIRPYGTRIDGDGYSVRLDGGPIRSTRPNDGVAFQGLAPGEPILRLEGLAHDCSVDGVGFRRVTVVAGRIET